MRKTLIDISNLCFFVLLAAWNYLLYNSYPLYSPEAILFQIILFVLLFLPYVLTRLARLDWIFYGFLVALFLDLSIGLLDRITLKPRFLPFGIDINPSLFSPVAGRFALPLSKLMKYLFSYGLFLVPILSVSYGLRRKIHQIIWVGLFSMWALTTVKFILVPEPLTRSDVNQSRQAKTDQPNILVLILDEYIGIEGIPLINQAAIDLKERMRNDYVRQGFEVYGKAHSNYYKTQYSIPSILNYALVGEDHFKLQDSNRFFQRLIEQGYALNIYQTSEVDFCGPAKGQYHQCHRFKDNSIGYFKNLPFPARSKVFLILSAFFEAHHSIALRKLYWFLSAQLRVLPWGHVESMSAIEMLERINRDLATQNKGTAFLAHLMFPHSPYVYDSECRLKDIRDWDHRMITQDKDREATRRIKQERYLEQVACTHRKLSELIQTMQNTGDFKNATVLFFGDHGSRITTGTLYDAAKDNEWNVSESNRGDLLELFSAFLVVKRKGDAPAAPQAGRYFGQKISLAQVFGDVFNLYPEGEARSEFDKIYLRSPGDKAKKLYPYEMVDF